MAFCGMESSGTWSKCASAGCAMSISFEGHTNASVIASMSLTDEHTSYLATGAA